MANTSLRKASLESMEAEISSLLKSLASRTMRPMSRAKR